MFRNDTIKRVTYCRARDAALRFIQRDAESGNDVLQFVMSVRGRHGVCLVEQKLGVSGLPPAPVTWTIRRFWTGGVIQHRRGWMEGQPPGPVHLLPVRLSKAARMTALQVLIEALEVYCINYGDGGGAWQVGKVLVDPASLKAGIEKCDYPTMEDVETFMPAVEWTTEPMQEIPPANNPELEVTTVKQP